MSSTPAITDPTTWALDREIVLVRVLDATREAVFAAWTDADAFCQWFGPDGFTNRFDYLGLQMMQKLAHHLGVA